MKRSIFVILISMLLLIVTPVYAYATQYAGIDVSVWQGNINFNAVKEDGKEIVYIRAGYGLQEDSMFQQHTISAKKAGLKIGFYFYVTATNTNQAQQQAEYFASLIQNYDYDCRPAVDFEEFNGLSNDEINNIALTFAKTLENETGVIPLFYTDAYNAETLWDDNLTIYPLWIANYGVSAPESIGSWSNWSGFQYSDSGDVSGISGNVDLDYFTDEVLLYNSALPFIDVPIDSWYYNSVLNLYKDKLIVGVGDNLFAPTNIAQRDMVITLLYRMDNQPTVTGNPEFTDVASGQWYSNSITWAQKANIAKGSQNDFFYPNKVASRQETVVFLYRYAMYKGYNIDTTASLNTFNDANQVANWAVDAMKWAKGTGIIKGTTSSTLAPTGNTTRAQMTEMVNRFIEVYGI